MCEASSVLDWTASLCFYGDVNQLAPPTDCHLCSLFMFFLFVCETGQEETTKEREAPGLQLRYLHPSDNPDPRPLTHDP